MAQQPRPDGAQEEEPSDRVLLQQHVAGDADAFAELVRRHRDRLWAVALRTTGDPDEAADAVQDALISAYRSAGSFRGEAAVTTWLHRVVVNACIDRARRRSARPTRPLPADDAFLPPARDEISERDTALAVTAALAELPVEQRAALVLVDIQGWSVSEAAAVLGVAEGTVKSRCSRGRARLLPLLSDVWGNRPGTGAVPTAGRSEPDGTARETDGRGGERTR